MLFQNMVEMPCMMSIYLSNGVNGLVTFQLNYVLRKRVVLRAYSCTEKQSCYKDPYQQHG